MSFVAYHQKCIDPWLLKNKRTCPVCKRRVISRPGGSSRGSTSTATQPVDNSESSSDSEGGSDERTPLLPPPAGPRTGNVVESSAEMHSPPSPSGAGNYGSGT